MNSNNFILISKSFGLWEQSYFSFRSIYSKVYECLQENISRNDGIGRLIKNFFKRFLLQVI
jgi:hypothetical protein